MKKSTIIGMIICGALIIGGSVFAGMQIAKPKPVLTDATLVRAELPVGAWGAILSTIERQTIKLNNVTPTDTTTKKGATDSIVLALNTMRKALTDQNEILKNNTK